MCGNRKVFLMLSTACIIAMFFFLPICEFNFKGDKKNYYTAFDQASVLVMDNDQIEKQITNYKKNNNDNRVAGLQYANHLKNDEKFKSVSLVIGISSMICTGIACLVFVLSFISLFVKKVGGIKSLSMFLFLSNLITLGGVGYLFYTILTIDKKLSSILPCYYGLVISFIISIFVLIISCTIKEKN